MHKLFTLVLLLCASASFSQTITLKGKVADDQGFPLESATIYLTKVKDSSMVDYTISAQGGVWELKTRKLSEPFHLKISYVGLAPYKQEYPSLEADRDFGTIKLADRSTELNEVVIEGEVPPIRIKKDTLEFDASSFKVRPDANVEALLKQLPGVEIDAEGQITVNGQKVTNVLVNGKPFFDETGKIALQNLPAEIIEKVQVTDKKTKEEELSGEQASGNEASINLTIAEENNKGLFGKFMGGYGTDKRYESSALLNYFKGDRRISVLASANNINSVGFSMDEIFDNMGGGRNMSMSFNSDGSFGVGNMRFGGNRGIVQSNMVGANYADKWSKSLDGGGSYFYSGANSENTNRTESINFLPVGADGTNESYISNSVSRSDTDEFTHNADTEFTFKIDSLTTIYYAPSFTKSNTKTRFDASQVTQRLIDGRLLNETDGLNFNENDNSEFSSSFNFNKAFRKKRRSLGINFENENRRNEGSELNQSVTNIYKYTDNLQTVQSIVLDRIRYDNEENNFYRGGIDYHEPVSKSIRLKVGVDYEFQDIVQDRDGFDFDNATNRYSDYSDSLSNYISTNRRSITPIAGGTYSLKKGSIRFEGGQKIMDMENFSHYLGKDYHLNRKYIFPVANASVNTTFGKNLNLWASYRYNVNLPSAGQMLPVEDVSNPLHTLVGNPDLQPEKSHSINMNFYNFDWSSRSGYSMYMGGMLYDSQVVSSTITDSSAKSTTTFENVNGGYYAYLGGNWNKSFKKDAHNVKFNLGLQAGYNLTKGFLNGVGYDTRSFSLEPKTNITYEYGELLTISPTYSFEYHDNSYTNNAIRAASNFVHKASLQTTSYWPKHVVIGNDFSYTYNSNIADGFRKDFFLWNTSVGYNFLNDKLLFKVKVYDVLNQNLGTSRTIGATSIYTEENTVLKRYAMFSLTFKLEKFGAKEKKSESRFWWF